MADPFTALLAALPASVGGTAATTAAVTAPAAIVGAGTGPAALNSLFAPAISGPMSPLLAAAPAAAPSMFAMPSLVKAASVGSSVMGAFQQRNAGISQEHAYKQQASQEGIKAREEGIIRREKLLNTLASQNARVGGSGITGATPNSVAMADIENFSREQRHADLGLGLSQQNSRTAGKNARKSGRLGAGVSLIDGYLDYKKIG